MTTQLKNKDTIVSFAFAGNATITLRSTKTGKRFTYKIQRAKPRTEDQDESTLPVFVSLLSGADNDGDFFFMGTVFPNTPVHLIPSRKSRITCDAPAFVAFAWWLTHIGNEQVEVWHEDRCGHCNRKLTVPESIATGLGPHCAAKLGVDIVKLAADEGVEEEEQLPDLYDLDPTDQSLFE